MNAVEYTDFLVHHGIKGQKWGVRRYQNEDGSLTELGKERYYSRSDQKELYKSAKKTGSNSGIEDAYKFLNKQQEIAFKNDILLTNARNKKLERLLSNKKDRDDIVKSTLNDKRAKYGDVSFEQTLIDYISKYTLDGNEKLVNKSRQAYNALKNNQKILTNSIVGKYSLYKIKENGRETPYSIYVSRLLSRSTAAPNELYYAVHEYTSLFNKVLFAIYDDLDKKNN